jgi:DNA-binding MarR family transcriptional regulator
MQFPCLCATARHAARALTQLYDERLRPAGLEAPQFAILMVFEQKGSASQSELCRLFALDKTTVSRNLRLMERKGWVATSAAKDKRVRQFVLTPTGGALLSKAKPLWKQVQNDLKSRMPSPEWEAMFQVFRSVAETAHAVQTTNTKVHLL